MNTTVTIFFLLLGQADGFATADAQIGSQLAVVPAPYSSLDACREAGEAARENNAGLSFLSYTCIPAAPQGKTVSGVGRNNYTELPPGTVVGMAKCDEVCKLIEAAK